MRRILMIITMIMSLTTPVLLQPSLAFADSTCPDASSANGQVLKGIGESGNGNCDSSGVTRLISEVINILSIFVGIAAVIMILVSGLKYITSGGDASKITNAKSSLIYALIGVAIAALAQFLVHFVINGAANAVT